MCLYHLYGFRQPFGASGHERPKPIGYFLVCYGDIFNRWLWWCLPKHLAVKSCRHINDCYCAWNHSNSHWANCCNLYGAAEDDRIHRKIRKTCGTVHYWGRVGNYRSFDRHFEFVSKHLINFWPNFKFFRRCLSQTSFWFWVKFRCLAEIFVWKHYFDFWPKFPFLNKYTTFDQNFPFFFYKNSIFDQNFLFVYNNSIFDYISLFLQNFDFHQNFLFVTKNSIFYQNFDLCPINLNSVVSYDTMRFWIF